MNAPHQIAMAQLAKELREMTAESDRKFRLNRQRFIESEIVEFRPDFFDSTELLDALKCGLEARLESDNLDLPLGVRDAFDDLRKALDASTPYEPDAYDSIGEDDIEYRKG